MRQRPCRDREQEDGGQTVPRPQEDVRLNRKNGDHEIIAESGVSEERTIARIFAPEPADQRHQPDEKDQQRDQNVYREQRIETNLLEAVLVSPMRRRPNKTEPGLNGCSERSLRGSQFVGQPGKIERDDPPNQLGRLKGRLNQFDKR